MLSSPFKSAILLFALASIWMLSFPMTAAAGIVVELTHVGQYPDEMPIGKSLDVGLTGASPHRPYTVLLVDDVNALVSMIEVVADGSGRVAPTRIWSSTGIKGCNVCPLYNPASYLFQSYEEAKTALDQRVFTVQIFRNHSPETLVYQAARSFKTIIDDPAVHAFPSNDAGCQLTLFEEDSDMYLSLRHTSNYTQAFRVWIVPAQSSWQAGDALVDVRPGQTQPQLLFVPPGPNPTLNLIWASVVIAQPPWSDYQIVIRPGIGAGLPNYDPSIDQLTVPPRVLPSGILIQDCTVCPPPADPVE